MGIIERDSRNFVMVPVPDRSANTLLPIIYDHVLPGTRVITDMWASYNQLQNNYDHATVNHQLNFVNPVDHTVHTNTIEGAWGNVKNKIRNMHGTSDDHFDSYLTEYIFRRFFSENIFGNLLYWISFYYDL